MGEHNLVIPQKPPRRPLDLGQRVEPLDSSSKLVPTPKGVGDVQRGAPKHVIRQKPRRRPLRQHQHLDSSSKLVRTPGAAAGAKPGVIYANDKKLVSETKPADIRRRLVAKEQPEPRQTSLAAVRC